MAVDQLQSSVALERLPGEQRIARKPQTYWGMALHSLRRDRLTVAAFGFILVIGALAILAGPITTSLGVNPTDTDPKIAFMPPYIWPYIGWLLGTDPTTAPEMLYRSGGIPHWLGTDQLGRDQLARLLYGGQISLGIALFAAAIAMVLGVGVGTVAGYFGGWVDDLVMWMINTLTTIPDIYLLIIVTSFFKPTPWILMFFLGFLGWFGTARFMRANVFKVRSLEFTTAARSVGATHFRIMRSHIAPNCLPLIVVITFVDIGALILTESVLSFLGLGVQPPTPSWGNMLYRANDYMFLRDPTYGAVGGPPPAHLARPSDHPHRTVLLSDWRRTA